MKNLPQTSLCPWAGVLEQADVRTWFEKNSMLGGCVVIAVIRQGVNTDLSVHILCINKT